MANAPVWLVVRRQTTKTGGIQKKCFTEQRHNNNNTLALWCDFCGDLTILHFRTA
jgi:hypothetical protein